MESYIETTKGIIQKFCKSVAPEAEVSVAFPEITGANFTLSKPLIYVEFERELNLDVMRGRHNGKGQRVKRKLLTFALQVVTTGDNAAVLKRDRVMQKIITKTIEEQALLSGKGIRKAEAKYLGSFRVREGVHLARLEFYCEVKFIN